MHLTSIPQLYRNVNRWTEILSVLSRYGLADWISQFNFDFAKGIFHSQGGEVLSRTTREARIRLAISDLGPTFIKLGQILSTRADLVGVALADELKQLQCDVPADTPEQVRATVEEELGSPLEEVFEEFDLTPIASASIGQVHRARLAGTCQRVVVKVQHAGISEKVRVDLEILAGLAQLAEQLPEFEPYRPRGIVAEFQRQMRREMDFGREAQNLEMFHALFVNHPHLRIPVSYSEFTTPRVLTMEVLDGIKIADRVKLVAAGYDLEEIARRGANVYLDMIFKHGVYHADPHPGNILVLPGNVLGLLDFGMVGRIDERLKEDIEDLLLGILHRDAEHLTNVITRIGAPPPDLDRTALRNDVADFVTAYAGRSLERFDLSGALREVTEIIRNHQIQLPAQVALLIKVLVMLEGTGRLLSPRFSLIELIEPLQPELMWQRFSPARYLRKATRIAGDLEQLAEVLPRRMLDILDQVATGRFDIHLEHRRLGPSVNRLVLGLICSALFLGSALLLSQHVPPLLAVVGPGEPPYFLGIQNISILGLAGLSASILLGLRLFWAIIQSGNLEKSD